MIKIQTFTFNMLQENCYVAYDETREAAVIDCGAFYAHEKEALASFIEQRGLKPRHLLATHGHLDHCFGNAFILARYGLKVEVMGQDDFLVADFGLQARSVFGFNFDDAEAPVGRFLADGDVVSWGSHSLAVLSTPGHTPGSALFYCKEERVVFTGDTLFRQSIGRTDFERGSYEDMAKSLANVVKQLPAETVVYPGHGPQTTIGLELRQNPYLR